MSKLIYAEPRRQPTPIVRCVPLAPPAPRASLRLWWSRLAQSFRLMVGVRDYQTYLQHMRRQHPSVTPMSERAFHRYCLEARFPSEPGKVGKCPC
ncbi:YbdD/YjiX family protein [Pantoea sp. 1.19]|uniref:YbdD/YjiX family protein n=1 Tax=Pantoea sp. 1.19 TaxID=1925589 RepID=UPI000948FDCF|nr:CstA-like transporter-associated (seleno)protein [Pantoea sp. 1.19]